MGTLKRICFFLAFCLLLRACSQSQIEEIVNITNKPIMIGEVKFTFSEALEIWALLSYDNREKNIKGLDMLKEKTGIDFLAMCETVEDAVKQASQFTGQIKNASAPIEGTRSLTDPVKFSIIVIPEE